MRKYSNRIYARMIKNILRTAVIISFLSFLTGCRYYIPEADKINRIGALLKENQELKKKIKNLKENPPDIDYKKLAGEKYTDLKCLLCRTLYATAEDCHNNIMREHFCPNVFNAKKENMNYRIELSPHKPEDILPDF